METESIVTLVNAVLAIVVPLIISGFRKLLPSIPKMVLPMVAPLLGVLLAFITTLATSVDISPITGAILGAVGVWVRELSDQVSKSIINHSL